jgi:hypothetical protein
VALISNGRINDGLSNRRDYDESAWTKLLLERGEAELADSEKRWLAASKSVDQPAVSPTPAEPPTGGLYARTRGEASAAVSQTRRPPTTERRRALRDMAERLRRKRGEKPS